MISSTMLYGFKKAECYDERICNLKSMNKIIKLIQSDLEFNKLPFSTSIKRITKRNGGVLFFFLIKISEMMEKDNLSLSDSWSYAARECRQEFYGINYTDKDVDKLIEVGRELINSDEKRLNEVLGFYANDLKNKITQLERDRDNKIKIYRSLGVIVGVFLLVILW